MQSLGRLSWGALGLALLVPGSAGGQMAANPQPQMSANVGWVGFNQGPKAMLADHRQLTQALAALKPQRKGVVDAYVVVAALDGDPVFGREAREAGRVLTRRFGAAGRSIVLAAGEGNDVAPGSPANFAIVVAQVAELMDRGEDVLIVYTTSHGSAPNGLAFKDRARGGGLISPDRYLALLNETGIRNRLIMVSACFSGIFVPKLASDTSVVISAAAADRSSFGCAPTNEWTYFGDALVNRAFRKPQPLAAAFAEASATVTAWERARRFNASNPQISVGKNVQRWLAPIEARAPKAATAPVGRSPAGP